MRKAISYSLCLGLLTACGDGNPFTFGVTGVPIDPPTGGEVAIGLATDANVAFFANAQTITVEFIPLDQGTFSATYDRKVNLDVPGYQAYSYQDDSLDRMFVAIVAESPDAAIQAATVMDGGQFTKFFGGAIVTQVGAYSADTGLVSYAGTYAGLSNINAPGAELLPVDPSIDPALLPAQPTRVTGDVFINTDFTDNTIDGAITNQELVEYGTAMPDVFLMPTTGNINATNGSFEGTATGGSYEDQFGGAEATSVGGAVDLGQEYGIFVLAQCGPPGDAAICANVN